MSSYLQNHVEGEKCRRIYKTMSKERNVIVSTESCPRSCPSLAAVAPPCVCVWVMHFVGAAAVGQPQKDSHLRFCVNLCANGVLVLRMPRSHSWRRSRPLFRPRPAHIPLHTTRNLLVPASNHWRFLFARRTA